MASAVYVTDGYGSVDILASVEKIVATSGNDEVSVVGRHNGNLTIDLGGGVNNLYYINGAVPSQLNGPLNFLYRTELEDGTPTGRDGAQTIDVATTDKVLLQNSILYVDGHQLVGGSSFKYNNDE
jgi:hypothetical protein